MNATRTSALSHASRRTVLRGMLGGAAVTVGLPLLDCFLDANGTAMAATGAPLPTVFGTWFWGCGLNPGRWEPNTTGAGYDMNIETAALQPFKDRINVISRHEGVPRRQGRQAALHRRDGDPDRRRAARGAELRLASTASSPTRSAQRTRFRSLEVTGTGKPTDSLSPAQRQRAEPGSEISPAALYTRVFGPDFRDPNAADFQPDPKIMVRRLVF